MHDDDEPLEILWDHGAPSPRPDGGGGGLPDIVCSRHPAGGPRGGRAHVSIPRPLVHHSPDGYEWGYGGSGPADLALNILHLFLPPDCDAEDAVPLWRGRCSSMAWRWHQDFKRQYVAALPPEGGVIYAREIVAWIRVRWPEYDPPGD